MAQCTIPPAIRRTVAGMLLAGCCAVALADQGVSRLFEDAVARFNEQDLATAEIQLKNVLEREPAHLSARILLGRVHLARGDGAAAEKELLHAQQAGADPTLVEGPLAEAYVQQRKFQRLLETIFPAAHTPQVQVDITVLRGQAHLELGDLDAAERSFVEALGLKRDHAPALLGSALVMLRRHRLDAAEQLIDDAVKHAPEDAEVWYLRGELRRIRGERADAIDAYGEALARAPLHAPARLARAALALELGREDAARADLDRVREEFPFEPQGRYLTALLRLREGDKEQARAELNLASAAIAAVDRAVVQRHAPSLLLSGLISFLLRDFETAALRLESYLERFPHSVSVRTRLAYIHLERDVPRKALEVLEPALARAPNDPLFYSLLGDTHSRLGNHAQAAQMLDRAASLAPERAVMRIQLAQAQLAAGAGEDALQSLHTAWALNPESARAGFALGGMHFSRGEYARAQRIFSDILSRTPDNLSALNMLGAAQMRLGQHDAAQVSFERALSLDAQYLAARINLATLERARGRPDAARERHLAILEQHPEQIFSMRELASLAREAGEREEAIRWLEKARATDPDAVAAQLELVDLYLADGRTEPALTVARDLEARAGERLDVLAAVARVHIASGRLDLARNKYQDFSKVASFRTRALVQLARLQVAIGDLEAAHWSLHKAVRGDLPDDPQARTALVRVKIRLGKLDEALELAQQLAASHGAAGQRLHGEALLAAGRFDEARAAYAAAQADSPTTAGAIGMFRTLLRAGEHERALGGLEDWLAAHPADRIAVRTLAGGLIRAGRFERARALYEQLAEQFADDAGVHNDLALLRHETGQPGALEAAQRAYALAPERADVLDTLGWLLVQQDRPEEALRYLRAAHSRAARNAEIRYHLGVALARLGRNREARVELEAALAQDSAFADAARAKELLERLPRG